MYKSIFAIIFALLLQSAVSDIKCHDPQHGFYMSYGAMGKRDTLGNLFT